MVNVAYEIERLVKFAVRKKMITVWDIFCEFINGCFKC